MKAWSKSRVFDILGLPKKDCAMFLAVANWPEIKLLVTYLEASSFIVNNPRLATCEHLMPVQLLNYLIFDREFTLL